MSAITDTLQLWAGNFTRNFSNAFVDLRLKDYIRLVIIIGSYCLLRPHIIAYGAKLQAKAHERDSAEGAEIHPNELRGKHEIPGVDDSEGDDEDEDEESKPGDWGRNARVRQRKFIRLAMEKEEQRLRDEAEAESDKELEEFLTG